jgi:predicted nucleotide-binding protein
VNNQNMVVRETGRTTALNNKMKKSNITHEGGKKNEAASALKETHRGRVKSDFPKHTLDEALRVARALSDKNGGQPLPPTDTAIALGISPGSSEFRTLLSSSIKYGLTSGSFNSEKVALEPGGRDIVEPTSPDDGRHALEKAVLAPATFKAIYEYFRGKKLPEEVFFQNTLVRELGVPREHAGKCVAVFLKNVERVGLVRTASTGKWLSTGVQADFVPLQTPLTEMAGGGSDEQSGNGSSESLEEIISARAAAKVAPDDQPDPRLNRVFVTHGKNVAFIAPIKDLLTFGQLEPVVAIERESVAKPVPEKVMNDMRTCGAAIIHIENESKTDASGKEQALLNSNVLIEIGAAMALYGRRYIFLVKEGVELPSNVRGLYEVRYAGDKLDGEDTIRLLRAINELKKEPLPDSMILKQ